MFNRILIKIILILLMIGFIVYLLMSASNLHCANCTVTLLNKRVGELESERIDYNMTDLYELTKTNRCPVYWDRVSGYVRN